MTIQEWWNLLDPDIRRWLVANPGCVVLPRTVVNAINAARGGILPTDRHGESTLSLQDREFIRAQANLSEGRGL